MCGFVGIFSPRAPVCSLGVDISAGMAAIRPRATEGIGGWSPWLGTLCLVSCHLHMLLVYP